MSYRIVRSNRKTVCIQLTREGEVVVRAPRRCPNAYIDRFVADHAGWIESHRAMLLERNEKRDGFALQAGDAFPLCGGTYTVKISPGERARLTEHELLLPSGDLEAVRQDVLALSRRAGLPWLRERLALWAASMGIDYRTLKLSSARTRWGSCSRDGVIRISVWLLFAPEECIDYVLVHELAHRRHFDHSKSFWTVVAAAMPDYADRRKALRRFQEEPLLQSLAKKGS